MDLAALAGRGSHPRISVALVLALTVLLVSCMRGGRRAGLDRVLTTRPLDQASGAS
jgi:hypothetical protein